jgi:hypothetical protein
MVSTVHGTSTCSKTRLLLCCAKYYPTYNILTNIQPRYNQRLQQAINRHNEYNVCCLPSPQDQWLQCRFEIVGGKGQRELTNRLLLEIDCSFLFPLLNLQWCYKNAERRI